MFEINNFLKHVFKFIVEHTYDKVSSEMFAKLSRLHIPRITDVPFFDVHVNNDPSPLVDEGLIGVDGDRQLVFPVLKSSRKR